MGTSLSLEAGLRERRQPRTCKSSPMLFGLVLALVLLLLYALTMCFMVYSVICTASQACGSEIPITDGMVFVFTTVGGLVSALVISQLAITPSGEHPAANFVSRDTPESFRQKLQAVLTIYLVVWILAGFAALVVGVMLYPGINKTLSDAGMTWIGVVLAALYSYFKLTPPSASSND